MSQMSTEGPELSLSQILEKYKDNWVAFIVTKRDGNFQPTAGRVVAHDLDRYRLRQQITHYNDICILFAGETLYPLLL
jgi:hypothetical protein